MAGRAAESPLSEWITKPLVTFCETSIIQIEWRIDDHYDED